jgi:transcriptional regulator with XRE-family HTH domain
MNTANEQFYALLREAMFANKLTASDLSAAKGVHYTYIYNTIRKNANITMQTAEQLAEAAGYRLVLKFEPVGKSAELVGNMESHGPLYSERRTKIATTAAEAVLDEAEAAAQPEPESLDAEVAELLAIGNA